MGTPHPGVEERNDHSADRPVAVVTCVAAWVRARGAAETFGSLLESATDLYALDLAAQLKLDVKGPLSRETGLAVTRLVRKDFTELTDP